MERAMPDKTPLDEILDFAIREEEAAHTFYTDLAARVQADHVRDVFLGFAAEELGHREKLVALREGRVTLSVRAPVPDLRIGDYLVAQEPHAGLTYQTALVLAMQKEKAAFRLYSDLAGRVEGPGRELLLALAQEEARHKLRFELEYDEQVLREN